MTRCKADADDRDWDRQDAFLWLRKHITDTTLIASRLPRGVRSNENKQEGGEQQQQQQQRAAVGAGGHRHDAEQENRISVLI
jgi:hypothetical protein